LLLKCGSRDSYFLNIVCRERGNHTYNFINMNSIRQTEQLNKRELEDCTPVEGSWHRDYDDTAFIYIGGLDERLTEGDVITIFSQYGEPVFINLVRDKETGKSKGFCFLKYEDQRSCDLAVDNLGGAKVLDRLLRVDHTRYKKRDDEDLSDNTRGPGAPSLDGTTKQELLDDTEKEESGSEQEPQRPLLKEEIELLKLMDIDDEDPMKTSLIAQKQKEVDAARQKLKSKRRSKNDKTSNRHHPHMHSARRKLKYDGDKDRDRRG
jgi:RNA-binding motif X-linked protein 2